MKKTISKKSRDTVPLNNTFCSVKKYRKGKKGYESKVPGRGFSAAEYAGPVDSGQVDRVCTILRYVLNIYICPYMQKFYFLKASKIGAATG
jgi:hypothetical protein